MPNFPKIIFFNFRLILLHLITYFTGISFPNSTFLPALSLHIATKIVMTVLLDDTVQFMSYSEIQDLNGPVYK